MTQSTNVERSPSQVENVQAISDQELEAANGGFSLGGIVSDVEGAASAAKNWTENAAGTVKNAAENHPFITGGIVATATVVAFATGAGEDAAASAVTNPTFDQAAAARMIAAFKD